MKTPEEISALANALREAQKAADALNDAPDTGSANLDSVTIELKSWRKADIDKVCDEAGIIIGDKIGSSWFKNDRFVRFRTGGQASRNYEQVQAAYKVLRDLGYMAGVYYQLD